MVAKVTGAISPTFPSLCVLNRYALSPQASLHLVLAPYVYMLPKQYQMAW